MLLATGVADAGLPIENWREAIAFGSVRLCPVCDGFDVMDKRIAVATAETNPVGHALFMRTFSADVTLFERGSPSMLNDEDRRRLDAAGVRYIDSPLLSVTLDASMKPVMHTEDGEEHSADVFYPMLGENARSSLAASWAPRPPQCDELVVDDHQATTVPGLYAIGDVVRRPEPDRGGDRPGGARRGAHPQPAAAGAAPARRRALGPARPGRPERSWFSRTNWAAWARSCCPPW